MFALGEFLCNLFSWVVRLLALVGRRVDYSRSYSSSKGKLRLILTLSRFHRETRKIRAHVGVGAGDAPGKFRRSQRGIHVNGEGLVVSVVVCGDICFTVTPGRLETNRRCLIARYSCGLTALLVASGVVGVRERSGGGRGQGEDGVRERIGRCELTI